MKRLPGTLVMAIILSGLVLVQCLLAALTNNIYLIGGVALVNIIVIGYFFKRYHHNSARLEKISNIITHGEMPNLNDQEEQHPVVKDMMTLHHTALEVVHFIESLEEDNFEFKYIDPDENIGRSLLGVAEKQRQYNHEEKIRSWKNRGLARFSEILRTDENDLKTLSYHILSNLVKYLKANQGAFFIEYEEDGERYMEMTACYAYDRQKFVKGKVFPGEGLVGQVMYEKQLIYIKDIPKDFVRITSGLGQAVPNNVVIIPLILNDIFYGAIELASFQLLEEHQREFLIEVSENIAAAIATVKTNEHTRYLLENSQRGAEELRTKEEEMRQNVEELQATQEEMKRKEIEIGGLFTALNGSIGLVEIAADREILIVNEHMQQIIGYSKEELGSNLGLFFPSAEQLEEVWSKLLTGENVSCEFAITTKHGEEAWLEVQYSPVTNEEGDFVRALLLIMDITRKKHREQEFERMSLVANNTDNAVIITDGAGLTEFINNGFTEMTGYSLKEMVGRKPGDVLQGADTDKETVARISNALAAGEPVFEEILNYKKDGSRYWITLAINPVHDDEGKIFKFIGIQSDITETKERALDYKYKLEAISRSNGIVEFDTEGNIVDANDNFLSIVKYKKEEVIGKHHRIFVPDALRDDNYKEFWKELAAGVTIKDDFERVDRYGHKIYLRGVYNPIYDLSGNIVRIVKFATDITQEKVLKEENIRQQEELSAQIETINKTIATLEFDPSGKITGANNIFLDVAGYEEEELLDRSYEYLLPKEELGKPQHTMMWESLKAGNYFTGQFVQKAKSGDHLWVLGAFNPLMNEAGELECIKMFGVFNTLEKKKELDMMQMLEAFKHYIPVVEVSTDGRLKKANDMFHELFGVSKMQLRKTRLEDIFSENSTYKDFVEVVESVGPDKPYEAVFTRSEAENTKIYRSIFYPIYDGKNSLEKLLLMLMDKETVVKVS